MRVLAWQLRYWQISDLLSARQSSAPAFAQRGLIAEHSISWTLPRLIGSGNALDLLWSARKFDGEEAHRLGFAERLVDTGEALAAAKTYIKELASSCSPTLITNNESSSAPTHEYATR